MTATSTRARIDADRPAWRSHRAVIAFAALFLLLLAGDLALKHWSFHTWPPVPVDVEAVLRGADRLPPGSTTLVPHVLALKLALNTGAVFGIGAGYRWVFVIATILAIGVIGYFFCGSRAREWWVHGGLALILAGAIGNLYDRIVYGAVRDMLWLFPGVELPFGWTWPGGATGLYPWVFNAADSYLLAGIGIILVRSFLGARGRERAERAAVRPPVKK